MRSLTIKKGTKEWAEHNKNMFIGCLNNCRYCYAKNMALRYNRIEDRSEWGYMKRNKYSQDEKPKKLDGRIMFPSTHDIFLEYIEEVTEYLKRWLEVGNEFLIVSKPRLKVIMHLCNRLERFKDQITFRFTITSSNNRVLSFWERNAPTYNERMVTLDYVRSKGWNVSVSIEPYLDETVIELAKELNKIVNGNIWIGKMNKINQRVDTADWSEEDFKYLKLIKLVSDPAFVKHMYEELKIYDKVKWKDSIREMLDLEEYEEVG